ncbi:unnamed protein product [Rotaria sp. Silwood2]|nr:unnamed protein product [Rotaria sp. Silwood2]
MNLHSGQEIELCQMIVDICAQQRTYEHAFGLLGQHFCLSRKEYVEYFEKIFQDQYKIIDYLEYVKLRKVAKFFAHLLVTDAISWAVFRCIRLTKEDTTSSSRVYIFNLFLELTEYLGLNKLKNRLTDPTLTEYFQGLFPRDSPKNSRFSVKFFTLIGLGDLTLGTNIHLISKVDLKKLIINTNELNFFQWLFNAWNIAYPISLIDQNDNNLFVLFNSIALEPPVPLNTIWSESWSVDEYESEIYFHLLHPCDSSILFYLYKLFPSQKILLASKNFLLIQEGNDLMYYQWKHLALYHYLLAPTLTSTCNICGLHPIANKALYDSCTILSPTRHTIEKKIDTNEIDKNEDQSSSLIFELDKNSFSYTSKYNMRPDGFNSFEVMFLTTNNEDEQSNSPIFSSIHIGCLMNNFHIKEDEQILFKYGTSEQNQMQEIYNGSRLRINILFTDKPNIYELVLLVNNIPWSRQTIKRKLIQTMFQPFIQTSEIDIFERNIRMIILYNKSALDKAIINPSTLNTIKKPWKVGMRLEAKNRKNPSILAIANITEVYDDNRIRINFDGWTSTFDYTAAIDNPDFHPCGYWEYIQRVLYKNVNTSKINSHFTFTRYDKPKSYDDSFSWRNYLTQKNQEPVPFECFNDIQTEGMPIEYFPYGITKSAFTCLSCRHIYNVRVKYHKMKTIIQNEIVNNILYEHHIESANPTSITSPGIVLLPIPFDISTLTYPCLKQFQYSSDFYVHLTCNHRSISPLDSTTIISGGHLMDSEGDKIKKDELSMPLITLCMLTAIDLVRNQLMTGVRICFSTGDRN